MVTTVSAAAAVVRNI